MTTEMQELAAKIDRFKKRLNGGGLTDDQRLVFEEALKTAMSRYDDLAQSAKPVTQPATQQEPPRYTQPPASRTQPPIAQQPQQTEATAEQVAAYLANRQQKQPATNGQQPATASAQSDTATQVADAEFEEKKNTARQDRPTNKPAAKVVGMAESATERVVVFQVEQPVEYVPTFSFIKSDGTEVRLKPGDIWGLFRSRMNDLAALKKPLEYSRMLPWAVAYYEALCSYHRRELQLSDFAFSSERKQAVFQVIREMAEIETEADNFRLETSRTNKPKYSRRAAAVRPSKHILRQKARSIA